MRELLWRVFTTSEQLWISEDILRMSVGVCVPLSSRLKTLLHEGLLTDRRETIIKVQLLAFTYFSGLSSINTQSNIETMY